MSAGNERQNFLSTDDATLFAYATVIGYKDGNGKFQPIQSGSPMPVMVLNPTSDQVAGSITAADVSGGGANPTANSTIALGETDSIGTLSVQISGNSGGSTLQFEATINGSVYFSVTAVPVPSGSGVTSTTAASGQWQINVAGYAAVRVRCSTYVSGTTVVAMRGVTIGAGGGATTTTTTSSVGVFSANFTRPANTTAYVIGQAVANSTTAGSVVALAWNTSRSTFQIQRVRLQKSNTSLTNAAFRIHFYGADPTLSTGIIGGDGATWSTKVGSYLGWMDVLIDKAFSDASKGVSVPGQINVSLASGNTVYGLIEARGAYTPASGETITAEVEIF